MTMSFLLTVLTLSVVGISFQQFTKETLKENNYADLYRYAQSVQKNSQEHDEIYGEVRESTIVRFLQTTKTILKNQEVNLYFVMRDNHVIFPSGIEEEQARKVITKRDWQELEKGDSISKTLPTDFFLKKDERAYVMVPYYKKTNETMKLYGALVVTQPTHYIKERLEPQIINLIKGFFISIVFAFLFGLTFSQVHIQRIQRLRKVTNEIAKGNFCINISPQGNDELTELAEDFNKMALSLSDSEQEILRQEERRKQFMADASHEMRTPLTTIHGLLEGFEYGMIPEDEKKNAIILMKNETNRLIRLVQDNLDYEKIRTGQITLKRTTFNACEVVQNILVQMESAALEANNELIFTTSVPMMMFADKDRFTQIVVNLVNNAIQFTKNGTITLSFSENELETILTVQDTGIGMDEESMKNIWERYFKADPSRKNTTGESGLGLSIVKQLMDLNKGKIEVESELGVGTTFILKFIKRTSEGEESLC